MRHYDELKKITTLVRACFLLEEVLRNQPRRVIYGIGYIRWLEPSQPPKEFVAIALASKKSTAGSRFAFHNPKYQPRCIFVTQYLIARFQC